MSFGDYISGYYDVGVQLPEYLKQRALQFTSQELEMKRSITDRDRHEQRMGELRKYFLGAIGGLPEKTPLLSECTGIVEREQYTIRKIVFQSHPGVYVTANLYLPRHTVRKVPAVVFACGHDEPAKASELYQKVCIDLAQNGIAAFAVDPISQGERMQYFDKEAGRNLVRWHAEHTYIGQQCELTGSSVIRYFVWDLVRAIDYLCELEEIDSTRIGMTGNSGGGIQTLYMMLADDRLAAAAPCTYVTSREVYMKTGQPQDGEQILYGMISEGLNYDDFVAAFAPKPTMIGAVESDFFCIEGLMDAYKRLQHVYSLYDDTGQIELGLVPGLHAYNDDLRETVVNWFVRTFIDEGRSYETDRNLQVEDVKTLQCTQSGQVVTEYADARTIHDLIVEYLDANPRIRPGTDESSGESLISVKSRVRDWLNMPQSKDPIYPRYIRTSTVGNKSGMHGEMKQTSLFFFTEPDIAVTGIYVEVPGRTADRCTILVHEAGAEQIHKENDMMHQLLREGDVLAFDPRGMGAVKSRPVNGRPFYEMFGTEYKLNSDAQMMRTSLTALRVYDILRACDFVRQHKPGKSISLAGKGWGAVYALLATVLEDDADSVYLENMLPSSFEKIVRAKYYKYDVRQHLHGLLKHFDIPELLDMIGDKKITEFSAPDVGEIIWW